MQPPQQQQQFGQPPGAPNPYAAPVQGGVGYGAAPGAAGQDFWREGDLLVARKGVQLPDVCMATGVPTGGNQKTKKLQWYPPWCGIVVVLSPLIGIILMLILMKKGQLTYYLSAEAQAKRKQGIVFGLGGVVLSFVIMGLAAALEAPVLIAVGGLLFIVGLVLAIVRGMPFQVKKIDKELIYLKMKPAFWPGIGM